MPVGATTFTSIPRVTQPCVFIHYSDSNIRQKSIKECLQSPLFYEYYKGQPFNNNMLRPCPMLENPAALRRIVSQTGAKSTNFLAPESAEALCAKCDAYAAAWAPTAKRIWEEKSRFRPFTQYYRDTRRAKRTARCKSCKTCPCLRRNKREHKMKKRTTLYGRALLCALIQNWFLRSSAPAPREGKST